MYRPRAFAVDDSDALHAFIRNQPFATVAAVVEGAVQLAYAPVAVGADGAVRFHLARANPLASLADGAAVRLSFMGAHAFVSPDWYVSEGMVPTWNYSAVEGAGMLQRLDEDGLRTLLVDLSAAEEAALLPKKPWTIDKVPAAKMAMLLNAIIGFSVAFESLEGKFKLSQNLKSEDFDGARRGLQARGDPASAAVAEAMRKAR
jgi:transcriptional regulator